MKLEKLNSQLFNSISQKIVSNDLPGGTSGPLYYNPRPDVHPAEVYMLCGSVDIIYTKDANGHWCCPHEGAHHLDKDRDAGISNT